MTNKTWTYTTIRDGRSVSETTGVSQRDFAAMLAETLYGIPATSAADTAASQQDLRIAA